jgi:hypothetical protein
MRSRPGTFRGGWKKSTEGARTSGVRNANNRAPQTAMTAPRSPVPVKGLSRLHFFTEAGDHGPRSGTSAGIRRGQMSQVVHDGHSRVVVISRNKIASGIRPDAGRLALTIMGSVPEW